MIGAYTVVADVGRTLVKLLQEQMIPEPIVQPEAIGLAPPTDRGDLNLSLFLYNIRESQFSRTGMVSRGTGTLQYPPTTVSLHYLLTAHSTAELQSRALDEHRILGRAMQVLYDHGVLKGSILQGTLAESQEELRIVRENLTANDMFGFWGDEPYKLSLGFTVGPVHIDSTRTKQRQRIVEQDARVDEHGPEARR